MQEIPRSSSRREFATIYVEPIREAYMHLHRGGYIHVVIDMFKVDSTLCAITRWEVPEAIELVGGTDYFALGKHLKWIPGWLCPHNSWQATWIADFCNGSAEREEEADDWCPSIRCRYCSTDFSRAIETLADGKRCLVLTTWKILGDDRLPETREWTSHCQVVNDDEEGFSFRRDSLRHGGSIRAALTDYQKTGKGLNLRGLWVREEDWGPPDILQPHVNFRETDRLRRHRRGVP